MTAHQHEGSIKIAVDRVDAARERERTRAGRVRPVWMLPALVLGLIVAGLVVMGVVSLSAVVSIGLLGGMLVMHLGGHGMHGGHSTNSGHASHGVEDAPAIDDATKRVIRPGDDAQRDPTSTRADLA